MARNSEPTNIESEVLLPIKREEFNDGAKIIDLRVIDWIVNGKHYPQLEKRELYLDANGEQKMGKAKGLNRKDMLVIGKNWVPIMGALGATMAEDLAPPVGSGAAAPATSAASTATAPVSDEVDF